MQLLFAFMLFSEDMPTAFDISSWFEASQSSDYNGQIDFSSSLFITSPEMLILLQYTNNRCLSSPL